MADVPNHYFNVYIYKMFLHFIDDWTSIFQCVCISTDSYKLFGRHQRSENQQSRHTETRPFPQFAGPSKM